MTEDFPNLAEGVNLQIQEAEQTINKPKELYVNFNYNQTFEKERQNILEAVSEKRYLFYGGKTIWFLISRSVIKNSECPKEVVHFSSVERKELSTRVLYTAEILFRNEGEIKTFLDEGILRKFFTSRPTLKKW